MSNYPRDYSFQTDGKVCALRYRALRKAAVADFTDATKKVEKFILEGDLEGCDIKDPEPVSVWLGAGGKLVNLFREELGRRAQNGATDFLPGELIVITQSDERRPSRTSQYLMWDYDVEFEHPAPPPTAAALLLEGVPASDDDGALDDLAGEPGPDNDDAIPF